MTEGHSASTSTEATRALLAGASPWKRYLYLWTILPWWTSVALIGLSLAGYERNVAPQLAPRLWSVPAKENLHTAAAVLAASPASYRSPYKFQTTSGDVLMIYCRPIVSFNGCIGSTASIVQHPAVITYFEVQGGQNTGRDVITSLSVDGRQIMALANQLEVLTEAARIQDETHNNTPASTIAFIVYLILQTVIAVSGLAIKITSVLADRKIGEIAK